MQAKVSCLIVLAMVIAVHLAQADDTNAPSPARIRATAADKHYGENVIVTGKVVQVTIRPKVVFLNFEQPFPDSPFTGVIFSRLTNQFGDLPSLRGKNVEVRGMITNYQNKPEIVLTNAKQLSISGSGLGTGGRGAGPEPTGPGQ